MGSSSPLIAKRPNDLGALVDRLGKLKAKISVLCEEEKGIKDELILSRLPEIDGDLFRATISTTERTGLDIEKVKKFLTPAQLLQCTKVSEVTTLRVNAKIKSC
jgi:hypothetical protein